MAFTPRLAAFTLCAAVARLRSWARMRASSTSTSIGFVT